MPEPFNVRLRYAIQHLDRFIFAPIWDRDPCTNRNQTFRRHLLCLAKEWSFVEALQDRTSRFWNNHCTACRRRSSSKWDDSDQPSLDQYLRSKGRCALLVVSRRFWSHWRWQFLTRTWAGNGKQRIFRRGTGYGPDEGWRKWVARGGRSWDLLRSRWGWRKWRGNERRDCWLRSRTGQMFRGIIPWFKWWIAN